MDIKVKNYRAVEDAELELAPIALVAGQNEGGKTSIAQAVAAALTRNPMPIADLNKADTGLLLRDGTKRGNCIVGQGKSTVTASWPGGSVTENPHEGETPPSASEIACGLISIPDMKPAAAAAALIDATGSTPTLEEFEQAMAATGVAADVTAAVWAHVVEHGWDATYKRAKDKSPVMKGGWAQITGRNWGAALAEGWRAEGYIEGAEIPDLQAAVDQADQEFERAIAHEAVSADEIERMRTQETAGKDAQGKHMAALERASAATQLIDRLERELGELPKPETDETLAACPHCEAQVRVVNQTTLARPTAKLSKRENDARRQAIATKQTAIGAARKESSDANDAISALQRTITAGSKAAKRLEAIPEGGVTAAQVQEAGEAAKLARTRLQAAVTTAEARAKHAAIASNAAIMDVLAPTGLRQTVLAARLEELNDRMRALTEVAGWAEVKLEDDLRLTSEGRPYVLLSAAAQFRARTVLQVMVAEIDGSAAVLIDAADILDRAGRNGLLKLLTSASATSGLRALVTMTMNAKADVPNLSAAGIGRAYWLAEGTLWPCHTGR